MHGERNIRKYFQVYNINMSYYKQAVFYFNTILTVYHQKLKKDMTAVKFKHECV